MRFLNRLIFCFLQTALVLTATNSFLETFIIKNYFYLLVFWITVYVGVCIITPFLLEFLTLKTNITNRTLLSTLIVFAILWAFNDFMPFFYIITRKFTVVLEFSFIVSFLINLLYKIAKKI